MQGEPESFEEKIRKANVKADVNGVSPSFCLAKWYQVTLHLHNGNTQSCHHVKSHKFNLDEASGRPTVLHNTGQKKDERRQMLAGRRPKECEYCWKIEDAGGVSDRYYKSSEDWAAPRLQEAVGAGCKADVSPSYVEISFDSACNLKCMYCSPAYSTSWYQEIADKGPYPTLTRYNNFSLLAMNKVLPLPKAEREQAIDAFWKWWPDLSRSLQHLRVTGGEPLLSRETWKLFERLKSEPQPRLNFNVNSNMTLDEKTVGRLIDVINDLEGKVASFTLYCSVDTVGAQAEYIRYGLKFDRFVSNIERILASVRWPIKIVYMISVNALSLPGLKSLLAIVLDQRRKHANHEVGFDVPYLKNPRHMSIEILTKDFVKYLDDALSYMLSKRDEPVCFWESEIHRLARVKSLMLESKVSPVALALLRRDFYKMFKEYDRRRNLDFLSTFPEYKAFWRLCSVLAIV